MIGGGGRVLWASLGRGHFAASVRTPRGWVASFVACLVAFASAGIGALALLPALRGPSPAADLPFLVFLLLLLLLAATVFYGGRDYAMLGEDVELSGGVLTLTRRYPFSSRSEPLRAGEVGNLRAAGLGNGTVGFEARGRARWLRTRLDERDARRLVEELRGRLDG